MKTNLLLIEPDYSLAKLYADYLTARDYRVRICTNAQQAIDEVDESKPDAILMELQLTAHGGYEFLYELRSYPEWQSIPVIINTLVPCQTTKLSLSTMKRLGVKEYLYKPTTTLNKLLFTIDRHLLLQEK